MKVKLQQDLHFKTHNKIKMTMKMLNDSDDKKY